MVRYIVTCFLLCVQTFVWAQEFYVNQANGDIAVVNLSGCVPRLVATVFPGGPSDRAYGDIAFTRDGRLYGIRLNGRVHNINLSTNDTVFVAALPLRAIESFNSMVSDAQGLLYIASSAGSLFTLDPITGRIQRLGTLPFQAAGDLIFYKNKLYMAAQGNRLIEVNTANPAASRVFMNFNVGTNIFGIVSFSPNCQEVKAYAISENSEVFEIDFQRRQLSPTCALATNAAIYGAASALEFNAAATIAIAQIQIQNADCGRADGRIELTASGGLGTLQYSLDGVNYQSQSLFNNLRNGNYRLYIRDTEGCAADTTVQLQGAGEPVVQQTRVTPNACGNTQNGSLSVTAVATDNSTLSYSLDSVQFGPSGTFTNLQSGNYTVFVRTSRGCVLTVPIAVPTLPIPVLSNVQPEATRCGQANGALRLSSNSTPEWGHLYSLDGQNYQSTPFFNNLTANTYTIYVKDSGQCVTQGRAVVDSSSRLIITDLKETATTCGQNNGSLTVQGAWTDGRADVLFYQLNNNPTQVQNRFTNLAAQRYWVRLTSRSAACSDSAAVDIAASDSLALLTVAVQNTDCQQPTGRIEVKARGNGALTYFINNKNGQNAPIFTDLSKGRYAIQIKDSQNCVLNVPPILLSPACFVFIPNAFSPNQDGENDFFTVFSDENYIKQIKTMRLFNRWGNMVFERSDFPCNVPSSGWNGHYKGKELNPDVFVYYVEVLLWDNTTLQFKGDVTLMK